MLSPVKILRKTIVNALINRKTTVNCEVLRKTSVPCSIDMEHIISAPAFLSAEVGLIDAYTIDILFDRALNESKIPDLTDFIINFGTVDLTDLDGNIYTEVTIGTQKWIVENFKGTKYNDGTSIALLTDNTTWINDITGAYCYPNNDINNVVDYGLLYNHYSANNAKGIGLIKKIGIDQGYRVATLADFTTLRTFAGGQQIAGKALKEVGTDHWTAPNTGTDSYGFKAFGAGFRQFNNGSFQQFKTNCTFWGLATPTFAAMANTSDTLNLNDGSSFLANGNSIRLVKDI